VTLLNRNTGDVTATHADRNVPNITDTYINIRNIVKIIDTGDVTTAHAERDILYLWIRNFVNIIDTA
jgi:hypothetical protein